jgi:rhodanese-related sulfurtransferase
MLLWPYVRRGTGGAWVDTARATHLINREDALVVDVREPGEFGTGHILGAKNVPLKRIDAGEVDFLKHKEKPVILCCDNGERSTKAAAGLKKLGFTSVVNLTGGIGAWRSAGLPVEK